MEREIIQQIMDKLQELRKASIKKGLKEGNIGDLNKYNFYIKLSLINSPYLYII